MANLGDLVVSLGVNMGAFNRDMSRAQRRLQTFGTTARSVNDDFRRIGRTVARFGAVAGGVGAIAVKMAADFDKGITEIGTLMGGLTEGEMRNMKTELQSIAEATGQSLGKLTKARYDIVSAGFADAAESAELLDVAARSAIAGVTDVATTADLLTTTLNAYELSTSQAESVSDTLFRTVQLGKTTMGELGGVLGRAIPLAAELGINLDELGASIAVLTARGQNTDVAVTALRATFAQLLKPADDLQRVIDHVGAASGRALIESEGFQGALMQVGMAAEELGLSMADVFPNIRAMQAVFPLAGDAADNFSEALDQMETKTGVMDTAFQQMEERLSTQLQQTWQKFRNQLIELGEEIMPAVSRAMDDIGTALKDNKESISAFITQVGKIADFVVEHGDIIGKLFVVGTIVTVTAKLAAFAASLSPVTAAIAGLAAVLGTVYVSATKAAVNQQKMFEEQLDRISTGAALSAAQMKKLNNIMQNEGLQAAQEYLDTLGKVGETLPTLPGMPNIVLSDEGGGGAGGAGAGGTGGTDPAERARGLQVISREYARVGENVSNMGATVNEVFEQTANRIQAMGGQATESKNRFQDFTFSVQETANQTAMVVMDIGSQMANFLGSAFIELADSGANAAQRVHDAWHSMLQSLLSQIAANAILFGLANVFSLGTGGFFSSILTGNILSAQSGADFVSNQSGLLQYHPNEHVQVTPAPGRGRSEAQEIRIYLDGEQIKTHIERLEREDR